jgi:hypothetical protein
MDTTGLAQELHNTSVIVICGHEARGEAHPGPGEWTCAAGGQHPINPCIGAAKAWTDAVIAWQDVHETQHPASVAEFRRCQSALRDADMQIRRQIDRGSRLAAATPTERFLDGFIGYFKGYR